MYLSVVLAPLFAASLQCLQAAAFTNAIRSGVFVGGGDIEPQLVRLRLHNIPPGRVQDMDEWVRWSSDSLKKLCGESLLDRMDNVDTVSAVHSCQRFAVLSHGTQDDPVYNYFNLGALLTFQWPEDEVYQLPSRYSAPDGAIRSDRSVLMQSVVDDDVRTIPLAVRQTKSGDQFEIHDLILWNVFDGEGNRVGQTALFDRTKLVQLA